MPSARLFLVISLVSLASGSAVCQQENTAPGNAPIVQPGAPGQPSKTISAEDAAKGRPALSPADVAFMQGMVMHHGQAVTMTALIDARTRDEQVRAIGNKISVSQTDEMKFMKNWLIARGQSTHMQKDGMDMDMPGMQMAAMPMMPGMLTPQQMDALTKAKGAEFDRLFLSGMIQHHTGALTMVDDLFAAPGAGQDADLFDFATDVDNTQRAEIRIMQGILAGERSKNQSSAQPSSSQPSSSQPSSSQPKEN